MTTHCAPCISDLALLREAVTAVAGTACCPAHAVLLTHPHDAPGRRRARLAQLRQLAESKSATAPVQDQPGLEILIHEYTLAAAMDMPGQPRPDGSAPTQRERGQRPERGGDRERGDRPGGEQPDRPGEPPREGGRAGKRRGRGRGERGPVDRQEQVGMPPTATSGDAAPAAASAQAAPTATSGQALPDAGPGAGEQPGGVPVTPGGQLGRADRRGTR